MINALLEKDLIPEMFIRIHIRKLLKQRINEEAILKSKSGSAYRFKIRSMLSEGPIAIETTKANEQHYEVPARFYELVLGRYLKYSSGYWKNTRTLSDAEYEMLKLTVDRAEISNGQNILELGCGWGSLTLFIAKMFPQSAITAVSNSSSQAEYIRNQATKRNIKNIEVITCDINQLEFSKRFDRIVSVEMFEHMRNYDALLNKINSWMNDNGKTFIHIFTHKEFCYKFDVKDETDWMAKHFFSGGIMPSDWLLHEFSDILKVKDHWQLTGDHYAMTSEAWLENLKQNKDEVIQLFKSVYPGEEVKWFVYWKIFFLSCAELWNYKNGNEWIVSHYLLEK